MQQDCSNRNCPVKSTHVSLTRDFKQVGTSPKTFYLSVLIQGTLGTGFLLRLGSKFCEGELGLFCKRKICPWHIYVFASDFTIYVSAITENKREVCGYQGEGICLWHPKRKGFPSERVMLQEGCLCISRSGIFGGKALRAVALTTQDHKRTDTEGSSRMPTDTRAMLFSTEPGDQEEQITFTSTKSESDLQGDPREGSSSEQFFSQPCQVRDLGIGQKSPSCFSCTVS